MGALHVQSVVHQAVVGEFFVLGAWAAIVGVGIDADAAAWGEDACHLDVFGVHETDEVFHDDVDTVFVEVAVIAEGEEVEFERLALHHAVVGQVGDANLGEVGLSGNGAQGGELGAVELHPVVVLRVFVFEGFQHFWRIVLTVFGLLAKGLEPFVFTFLIHDFLIFR